MHAVVVRVTLSDDDAESLKELREQIVPRVAQAPGFVAVGHAASRLHLFNRQRDLESCSGARSRCG